MKNALRLAVFVLCAGVVPGLGNRAFAHCDTMDGPVVTDAKSALKTGDVMPVLKWVGPEHEKRVKAAYRKALAAKKKEPDVQKKAARRFYTVLVKLHRATEGAPFTGLKPAGTEPGPGVQAAEKALEKGSAAVAVDPVVEAVRNGIETRFKRVQRLRKRADESVEAGREYVAAYVDYIHFVKRLHAAATGEAAEGHGEAEGAENNGAKAGPQSPGAILEKEHALTRKVLAAAEKESIFILDSNEVRAERIRKMLTFFSNFVDRCHHAKEERYYFPAAVRHGVKEIDELVAELKEEHERGRELIGLTRKALQKAEAGDLDAINDVATYLQKYADMIDAHIRKENQRLVARVEKLLAPVEKRKIRQGYRKVEEEELGEGFHEKYHALAMEIIGTE